MKHHLAAALALGFLVAPLAAQAAEKTVVLNVENATCVLCAPIVKRSLTQVPGVHAVQITEADAMSGAVATVTFDDAVTTVAKLVTATTNAGYPSAPKS